MGDDPSRRSLSRRLVSSYALVFLLALGLFAAFVDSATRTILREDLADRLVGDARLVAAAPDPVEEAGRLARVTGARVRIVDGDGVVVADSAGAPGVVLAERPDVAAALEGAVGRTEVRGPGDAVHLAVAVPLPDGGAVRVSVPETRVGEDVAVLRGRLAVVAVVAGIVGLAVVGRSARRLSRPLEVLTTTASALASGAGARLPRPSSIVEIDELGAAVERLASDLGKRVEEASRERDTLERVLDALPQGVVLVDADDTIPYANPAAAALLGAVPDRLPLLAPHALQRIVREARSDDEDVDGGFDFGTPARSVRASARPLPGSGRVVVVLVDLTERLRLDAVRRDFVSDASHELKTPVAAIVAAAEGLRLATGRDPERAEAFASRVEDSARQLGRIVADLLDLSRLEASEMATSPVALDEVVAAELGAAASRARAAGVELVTRLEPVVVEGSPSDLALAVRNLCDNALRYTDPGGTVTVTVGRERGSAFVEVADTGAGIPSRSLPRIFERFYRVDVARSRGTGGTGLGLAIVKHVAERHGGTVTVESELGVGSTFRLLLPLAAE